MTRAHADNQAVEGPSNGDPSVDDDTPLYNSRIIKTNLEYLISIRPQADIDAILKASGINRLQVEDPAHWFSQRQVDAFHDQAIDATLQSDFSYNAGLHYADSLSLGPMKQYTIGLLNIGMVFKALNRVYPLLSRACVITAKTLAPNRMEVTAKPVTGVNEKAYQCQNRLGVFKAVGKFFHDEFNTVEHPECRHKGADVCRYIVSWTNPPHQRLKRFRNLSIPVAVLTAAACFPFISIEIWAASLFGLGCLALSLFYWVERLGNSDLTHIMAKQGFAAKEHIDENKKRYSSAILTQELGQVISTVRNTNTLINAIAEVMQRRLPFDRGAFLIANPERTRLVYRGGFGFTKTQEDLLSIHPANIEDPSLDDLIVKVFFQKKPLWISNPEGFNTDFSAQNLEIALKLRGYSVVSVPIIYEATSLGVLMLDNFQPKSPITQSDINMLMGIASQTAVGLINARSFQQLRESEAKYRVLAENVTDVIWILDINTLGFTYLSPAVLTVRGYTPEEALAIPLAETLTPASLELTTTTVAEELALEGRPGIDPNRSRTLQVEQYRKDGSTVWTEVTARFLRDEIQQVTHILGISRDISERKKTEQERRKLHARLQRAEKMEALGTLAGGVAHDLNNILAGIIGYPEMLLMDLPKNSPMRKSVQTILNSGQKAAAIVQDLLTLARRGVTVTEVVNLNTIVKDYLNSPEHRELTLGHSQVEFQANLDPSLLNISGSAIHLAKTVMNLAYNAAEAISGTGQVKITTANRYVDTVKEGYDSISSGDYAVLTIEDTGSGIPTEDIDFIFEPFYTKKKMGRSGTGLGMAVVWGTVRDHGGYIDVKSRIGAGTVFTLYFPITADPEAAGALETDRKDLSGQGEVILVVDDIPEQRDIASKMLRRLGYTVRTAASGEEAINLIKATSVALIVLDMIMPPGMDGLDTYRQIIQIHPGQKTIIASGYAETDRVREAQALGAGAYVKKPYTMEKIGLAVHAELSKR